MVLLLSQASWIDLAGVSNTSEMLPLIGVDSCKIMQTRY